LEGFWHLNYYRFFQKNLNFVNKKEHCFALTAETFVDKAVELNHYGGHYGGSVKVLPFYGLLFFKLLILWF
jgi:hypothetical protein